MAGWDRYDVGWDPDHPGFSEMHSADDGRWVRFEQAEARLREVEAERDAAVEEGDRLKAAHRKLEADHAEITEALQAESNDNFERAERAEQRLRSLLTDLQGEAGRIINPSSWKTAAIAAGRLVYLIRKYTALSSTKPTEGQQGGGKDG